MTITDLKIWLVERDGRRSTFFEAPEWAIEDKEYAVTTLVPEQQPQAIALSIDDTQERIGIMEELYELMQQEIDFLKERLESAVEVLEVVEEFSAKKSDNFMENKAKIGRAHV